MSTHGTSASRNVSVVPLRAMYFCRTVEFPVTGSPIRRLADMQRIAVLTALANVAETSEDLVRWIEMESELRQRFNPTRAEEQSISRMTRMRIQEYERERSRGVGA